MRHIKELNTIEFDGLGELGRHVRHLVEINHVHRERKGPNLWFYGPKTMQQQLACSAFGDLSVVESAQRLLDKIQTEISIPASTWVDDVAGFFPCVPEALSGDPECMRHAEDQQSNTTPLNIFVDLATSAYLTPNLIMSRGCAVLALVMALTAIRPVSLRVGCLMGSSTSASGQKAGDEWCAVSAVIDTQPLDLARAAWALTDAGCARRLFYAVGGTVGFDGAWPSFRGVPYGEVQSKKYIERSAEIFALDGETLYLPPMCVIDQEIEMMINRPTQWVNKKIEQFRA